MEKYADVLASDLQHQSERGGARTRFTHGITKNDHMVKACEEQGILFLFMLFLASTAGSSILTDAKDEFKGLGVDRMSTFVGTLEHMILFEEFMKCTTGVKEEELRLVEKFIPPLMQRYKSTIDRQRGNQLKIVKFHLMLHVVDDIRRFGVSANFSSGPSESRHKSHCKAPGKHTQRRRESFIEQVQSRYIEHLSIETATNDPNYAMNCKVAYGRAQHEPTNTNTPPATVSTTNITCPMFTFDNDKWDVCSTRVGNLQNSKAAIPKEYQEAMDYMVSVVAPALPLEIMPIVVYSECRTLDATGNTNLYRSRPNYRSASNWTDWVYADINGNGPAIEAVVDEKQTYTEEEENVTAPTDRRFRLEFMACTRPTEIYGFFTLPPMNSEINIGDFGKILANNVHCDYFIGTPLKVNPIVVGGLQHDACTTLYWSKKGSTRHVVPCERMLHPALVVPDYNVETHDNGETSFFVKTGVYTVIGPPSNWSDCFVSLARDYDQQVRHSRNDRVHRNIFD